MAGIEHVRLAARLQEVMISGRMSALMGEAADLISGIDEPGAADVTSAAAFDKLKEARLMIDECMDIVKKISVRLDAMVAEMTEKQVNLAETRDHISPEEHATCAKMISEQLRDLSGRKTAVRAIAVEVLEYGDQCVKITASLIDRLKDQIKDTLVIARIADIYSG